MIYDESRVILLHFQEIFREVSDLWTEVWGCTL